MTEAEWATTTDPTALLRHVIDPYRRGELGERKFILFAAACCRRVWELIADPRSRAGVEAAERYADKRLSLDDAQSACEESRPPIREAHARLTAFEVTPPAVGPEWAALGMALHAAMAANEAAACSNIRQALDAALRTTFAACCRECLDVADPGLLAPLTTMNRQGQTINFPPAWYLIVQRERAAHCDLLRDVFGNPFRPVSFDPAWRTGGALALARGMYDDRVFDRMPILADALQDAGCDDAELLGHCRGIRSHVRGCWVVDLVLGWDATA